MTVCAGDDPRTVVNARDLGGLPLSGGGVTRHGVLLRSDAPYAGDSAPTGLTWPPSTVVDLRDGTEAGTLAAEWPASVQTISNPLFSGARMDRIVHTSLVDLYSGMLRTSAPRIVSALNGLDPAGSTLIHCAAGKDRTGVVIATALLLAGVEPGSIVADYRKTEAAIADVYARLHLRRRIPAGVRLGDPILRTPGEAIDVVINEFDTVPGGVWQWFERHGGDVVRLSNWMTSFSGPVPDQSYATRAWSTT